MNVFCLFSSNHYYSNNGFAKRSIQKKTLKSPCLYDHNLTRNKGNSLKIENANDNKNSEKSKTFSRIFYEEKVRDKIASVQLPKLHLMMSFQMMLKNMFLDVYFIIFFIFFLKYSLGD